MFDYSLLTIAIYKKYRLLSDFAKAMGITPQALSAKLNNKSGWSQEDMIKAQELLKLRDNEIKKLFCTKLEEK